MKIFNRKGQWRDCGVCHGSGKYTQTDEQGNQTTGDCPQCGGCGQLWVE